MGLFSRQASPARGLARDTRDREYVLTGCPLVAQDDIVVLVDVTVRLDVRDDREVVLGHDPAEEPAIHAVVVLVLRQLAEQVPSGELLVGRSRVVEAIEKGFALAPVGAGLRARVTSVEVRRHEPGGVNLEHEFRVVRS